MQDNQDKDTNTDEVQSTREYTEKSGRWHECMSFVSVVCCQVEVSSSGRSLFQGNPTECGVSLCVM
jgi:hypothetical protein